MINLNTNTFFKTIETKLETIFGSWTSPNTSNIQDALRIPILFTILAILAPFYFLTFQHSKDNSENKEQTKSYLISLLSCLAATILSFGVVVSGLGYVGLLLMPFAYYGILVGYVVFLKRIS